MKHIRIIAALLLLCTLCGCSGPFLKSDATEFYYLRGEISYAGSTGVIASETQDIPDTNEPIIQILKDYLAGPDDNDLISPFPEGIEIINVTLAEGSLLLEFNDRLSELSGMDLTLACACITKTCLGLTDATSVTIRAEGAALDGAAQITMTADSLVLLDSSNQ